MKQRFTIILAAALAAPPTGGGINKAGIEDSPLVIVVSCKDGSEFDAGLACQNISAEAQFFGNGTHQSTCIMVKDTVGKEAVFPGYTHSHAHKHGNTVHTHQHRHTTINPVHIHLHGHI